MNKLLEVIQSGSNIKPKTEELIVGKYGYIYRKR